MTAINDMHASPQIGWVFGLRRTSGGLRLEEPFPSPSLPEDIQACAIADDSQRPCRGERGRAGPGRALICTATWMPLRHDAEWSKGQLASGHPAFLQLLCRLLRRRWTLGDETHLSNCGLAEGHMSQELLVSSGLSRNPSDLPALPGH
jgi:hypothetical protein